MSWFFVILCGLMVLDGFKKRARVGALPYLQGDVPHTGEPQTLILAPGVAIPAEAVHAARAHMESRGLDVLDLLPGNLPALDAYGFLNLVDTESFVGSPFARGGSTGYALLVSPDVLERAGLKDVRPASRAELISLAVKLKPFAPLTTDYAISAALKANDPLLAQPDNVRAWGKGVVTGVLVGVPAFVAVVVLGAVFDLYGALAAVLAWHLQPGIALAGQSLQPRDLHQVMLKRSLMELSNWRRLWTDQRARPLKSDALRPVYDHAVASGVERFFEPRRERCPFCDGEQLEPFLDVPDLLQHKPGRFKLDRCTDCDLLFQNPRLSLMGLNYYYRDFYDGLGEEGVASVFGWSAEPYLERARVLKEHTEQTPRAWLDVGCGHGHFCLAARAIWPETRFDGLDLSTSVDDAAAHGWVHRGIKGLFPEVAPQLANQYDVVSMSHYLEHVREPLDELLAAHIAVRPGGHLLIEVPDPDDKLGRFLGRLWLPFFQPQHQHLLSVRHLDQWLENAGFDAILWHRGEAHQTVDLAFACALGFGWLAGKVDLPWQPKSTTKDYVRHYGVWTIGLPTMLLAYGIDKLLGPLLRRPGWSNTYRVLARRDDAPPAKVPAPSA